MFERRYLTISLPKFDIMAVNELLGLLLGLIVVSAYQRDSLLKVPIGTNDIGAIVVQLVQAGRFNSLAIIRRF